MVALTFACAALYLLASKHEKVAQESLFCATMSERLNPTSDYVFKRLVAEAPDLLVDLINDLRPGLA